MASRAPSSPRRQVSPSQFLALLMAFVLLCVLGGVVGAGMVVPMALGANAATNGAQEIFNELPDDITPDRPSEVSYIYYSDGSLMAKIYAQNRVIKPLDQIAPIMQKAVIAVEDKRFYNHGAVDLEGITRAAVKTLNGKTEGASTLTQQYVKNVLIDQALRNDDPIAIYEASENSLARKAREAKLAISLEQRESKDQILEGYLNIAQFGRSVYGVEAAAQQYFGVSAADLTPIQAATIAGITKEPSRYDPSKEENLKDAQGRRNTVLKLMYQQNYIDKAEYEKDKAIPIQDTLNIQQPQVGCEMAQGAAFFCDYVLKYIADNPAFGKTEQDRKNLLYTGGLQITTTLNPGMQAAALSQAQGAVPADDPSGLEDAIVSVEPGTGYIRAMAQNRPYAANANDPNSGAPPGSTAINYSADQAHGGSKGFSPGSTWKVFTLAEWLKSGHTLNQTVNANKQTYILGKSFHSSCSPNFGSGTWSPGNSDGSTDQGMITVARATAFSVNTAYAQMETQLDLCAVRNTAWDIGLRPAITKELVLNAQGQPTPDSIHVWPSMTIGTQNAAPLQMAAAYATFASGGTYCDPMPIEKVTTTQGTEIPVAPSCNPDALPANVANTVTYALEGVINGGGAAGNNLAGRPAAGKTGTANQNHHTWFIGYTPQLSTAVWIGNAETDVAMQYMRINGRYLSHWYGSSLAAPTWKSYMNEVLAGAPVENFGAPDPALIGSVAPKKDPADPSAQNAGGQGGGDQAGAGQANGDANQATGQGNGNQGNGNGGNG